MTDEHNKDHGAAPEASSDLPLGAEPSRGGVLAKTIESRRDGVERRLNLGGWTDNRIIGQWQVLCELVDYAVALDLLAATRATSQESHPRDAGAEGDQLTQDNLAPADQTQEKQENFGSVKEDGPYVARPFGAVGGLCWSVEGPTGTVGFTKTAAARENKENARLLADTANAAYAAGQASQPDESELRLAAAKMCIRFDESPLGAAPVQAWSQVHRNLRAALGLNPHANSNANDPATLAKQVEELKARAREKGMTIKKVTGPDESRGEPWMPGEWRKPCPACTTPDHPEAPEGDGLARRCGCRVHSAADLAVTDCPMPVVALCGWVEPVDGPDPHPEPYREWVCAQHLADVSRLFSAEVIELATPEPPVEDAVKVSDQQFEQVALWKCEACGGENVCGHHRCQGCGVKDYGTPPESFTRTRDLVEALHGLAAEWNTTHEDILGDTERAIAADLRVLASALQAQPEGGGAS